ncbi:M56 family metallopeptidase [Spirulina subsalsa]|uniref:M56 family metallopeptidase n=1 Tax=Spirulina subsalsa TaxID=54311 RepID=UPI0002EAB16D|nr:M56 family metallopeptidase [Spirulina subsalsa]
MHLLLSLFVLAVAVSIRYSWTPCPDSGSKAGWSRRWVGAMIVFTLPPLLLVMTAIAVLCMGPQGKMMGMPTDPLSYGAVLGFLLIAFSIPLKQALAGGKSLETIQSYPRVKLAPPAPRAYLLDSEGLFCAQVGFWQPQLVVSQGLLKTLDAEHLNAVLRHEQAHIYYRDTFWFFWLGCLRHLTPWLPSTQALWEELLLLRELRADRWATQSVDGLLLAESLLMVVSAPLLTPASISATIQRPILRDRLQERIEALLHEPQPPYHLPWWAWSWLIAAFLPLLVIPFHC